MSLVPSPFSRLASATVSGLVSTAAQSFAGVKTFAAAVIMQAGLAVTGAISATSTVTGSNLSGTNTGDATIGTANGLSLAGQALSLAAADASNAGAVTASAQTVGGAKRGAVTALTSSSASVAVDLASANNFAHTLTENTTLAAPSNAVAGQSGVVVFTQHASSAKTLAFNSFWKFAGGTVPVLSTSLGAVDVFAYYVESASRATCSLIKDVR